MEPLNKYGYIAANIYFSGACNLKCKYCFQPKIKDTMSDVNKKIEEWIKSGKMEDDILKYIGKDTTCFSLWGGEPSINLPLLQERLPFIYSKFPNLDEIFYSTNISTKKLAQNTVNFIYTILHLNKKSKRKVKVSIQFSIDGPPEINDKDRIGSSAVSIMNNITYVLKALKNIPADSRCFNLFGKSTTSADTLKWYLLPNEKYENNLIYYYSFFEDYMVQWKEFCDYYPILGDITLVYPGNYTKEDGKILAKIQEFLYSEKFKKRKWRISRNFDTQYGSRIQEAFSVLKKNEHSPDNMEMLCNCSCSAGRSCAGISYDGQFHWCHSTYFFDKEVNEIIVKKNLTTDFEKNQGFSFRNFKSYIEGVCTVPYENNLLLLRTLNLTDKFWKNLSTRTQYLTLQIKELASSGLIDKCFLEDRWQRLAVTYLLFGGNECPADNVWEFGSPYIRSTSQMKLLFNGAFQLILVELNKKKEPCKIQ